jgi:hypothetical protein
MKNTILIIGLLFLGLETTAQKEIQRCNFEKAKKEKKISFSGIVNHIRNHGYFQLTVKNTTKDSLALHVETGRVFYTATNDYQPFVVLRSREIFLAPGEEKSTLLNTACGNASAKYTGDGFHDLGKTEMANADLVAALEEVEAKRLGNCAGIQSLVWAFTNDHSVASIVTYDGGKMKANELQIIAAKHKRVPIPRYQVDYEEAQENSGLAFSGKPNRVESNLQFILENQEDVRVVLRDEKGEIVKFVELIHGQKAGQLNLPVDLDVSGFSRGNYSLAAESSTGKALSQMTIQI